MVLAFDKAYDHVLKIDTTNYTHFIKQIAVPYF
ncbi:MAG: hypothetical protein ACI9GM_000146 [Salibacteraceae bacterium]|jgi:hypothetical protein